MSIVKSITEIMKNFKSLYGFGGRCLKIRDVYMDFEPCFKVHNLVSVPPKSIIRDQMINLDKIFHVVVSVYRLVKFKTRSSSLLNFGTAYGLRRKHRDLLPITFQTKLFREKFEGSNSTNF